MEPTMFRDRHEAGQHLAKRLRVYAGRDDVVVLGLPRGGVPVGHEVAKALGAPFDVLVVRKLGVPDRPELAMGAIARGGVRVLSPDLIAELHVTDAALAQVIALESAELERRERLYRGDRIAHDVSGRTVILVDDGLATGSTMCAAMTAVLARHPARVVIAAPVGARSTCAHLRELGNEVICAAEPEPFQTVGAYYDDFSPTSDTEIVTLLTSETT